MVLRFALLNNNSALIDHPLYLGWKNLKIYWEHSLYPIMLDKFELLVFKDQVWRIFRSLSSRILNIPNEHPTVFHSEISSSLFQGGHWRILPRCNSSSSRGLKDIPGGLMKGVLGVLELFFEGIATENISVAMAHRDDSWDKMNLRYRIWISI